MAISSASVREAGPRFKSFSLGRCSEGSSWMVRPGGLLSTTEIIELK
jgi:hypothetical protein